MPRQFALDAPKSLQGIKRHAVETVIGAQSVNAIFAMAGVVDEIVGFVPGTSLDREHHPMNCGNYLSESGRASPMRSRAAIDCAHIHEGDEGATGTRIAQHGFFTFRILYFHRIFWALRGRRSQQGFQLEGCQRRSRDRFDD